MLDAYGGVISNVKAPKDKEA